MKDTLISILQTIVEDPKNIVVAETLQDDTYFYTITVAKEDMGRVIGKDGKIIRAIRNAMKIPATKQNKRIRISLADSETAQ